VPALIEKTSCLIGNFNNEFDKRVRRISSKKLGVRKEKERQRRLQRGEKSLGQLKEADMI